MSVSSCSQGLAASRTRCRSALENDGREAMLTAVLTQLARIIDLNAGLQQSLQNILEERDIPLGVGDAGEDILAADGALATRQSHDARVDFFAASVFRCDHCHLHLGRLATHTNAYLRNISQGKYVTRFRIKILNREEKFN